jgi:hypothetical protein
MSALSGSYIRPFEIELGADESFRIVAELAEPPVAVETQDAAHTVGLVVVINVLRVGLPTDRTDATLVANHFIDLIRTDAIAMLQVIVAVTAVEAFLGFTSPRVVARLAIGVPPVPHPLIAREISERLVLSAVRTALHALIVRSGCDINESRRHRANH